MPCAGCWMPSTPEAGRRLFFALWPEPEVRRALVAADRRLGREGRRVAADKLHLTLVFLGATPADRQACFSTAAAAVPGEPFELVLDRFGYFPRPRVLWLGSSQPPAALDRLVAALVPALARCGFVPESRPFAPHVTLRRKARRLPALQPETPVVWPVRDFCLCESASTPEGVQYRVLERWPLAGGGEARP